MEVSRRSGTSRVLALVMSVIAFSLLLVGCGSAGDSYLEEGDQAPEFELATAQGSEVALSDYQSQQPVLLYFHMAMG